MQLRFLKVKTLLNDAFKVSVKCYITATRVGRKVHMQWSNLTQCGLCFSIVSRAVHTLLPLVLQRLDSCGIQALILILEKVLNCRYDLIIGPIQLPNQVGFFFSCWGRENNQSVPTSSKPQSCTAAIAIAYTHLSTCIV